MDQGANEGRKQLYLRLLLRTCIAVFIIFFITNIAPIVFTTLAPFFYAFLLALLLNPLISRLSAKFGLPRRLSALILVVLVIFMLLAVIGWLAYIAVSELIMLAANLDDIWGSLASGLAFLGAIARDFLDFFPGDTDAVLRNFTDSIYEWINTSTQDFGNYLLHRTPYFTTRIGSGIIDILVFIIASYFLTAEYHVLKKVMLKYSDGAVYKYFQTFKSAVKVAFGGYIKAQLILASIAFVIIFPALLIIGQEYAFLIALLVGFLDFIPLLGAATLFLPWGILEMLGGNFFYGVFLILLSWTFFFIRRIMEPKVMGSQTGLHPLVALLSIYAGWRVFGVLGAILGPIGVMVALNLIAANMFEHTAKDVQAAVEDFKRILYGEESVS